MPSKSLSKRTSTTRKNKEILRIRKFEAALKATDNFYLAVSRLKLATYAGATESTEVRVNNRQSLSEFVADLERLLLKVVPRNRAAIQKEFAKEYANQMIPSIIGHPVVDCAIAEIMLRKLECQCIQVNMINGNYWCQKSFDREMELRQAVESWRDYLYQGVLGDPLPIRQSL